jgi:hypothetical protein
MSKESGSDNSKNPIMTAEEREKILNRLDSAMADSSSLAISVAIGLLGIFALYEFSPGLTAAAWILLSIAYGIIIFLFGLQIFAFHQVN